MKEFYPGNRFYGHGNIIKKYSGFPRWLPLPVCIQHGWMLEPIQHDARLDAAENWYWSANIAKKYKKKFPDIKYRITGAPFLYLLKNINHQNCKDELREGTIVFPFHSTEKIFLNQDVNLYCIQLNSLPDSYKPITICIYHNDKKNGLDTMFAKHGFKIVCNGDDPYDDLFLYNFVKNIYHKKYLISNEWSSAMHYGAIMGCEVHLYGPKVHLLKSYDDNFSNKFREIFFSFEKEHRNFFLISSSDKAKQYLIAKRELGYDDTLSKLKMKMIFLKNLFKKEYIRSFFIKK